MRRKPVSTNSHDGPADLPSNAKLRAFRCQDFSDMSRKDRLAYANAVHAAIRADNQRRGQSYAPAFRTIGECQVAYDRHMAEQRARAPEPQPEKSKRAKKLAEMLAERIDVPVKPSILPALLADHFDQGARKLAAHLVANAHQSAIYAAISRACHTLGI